MATAILYLAPGKGTVAQDCRPLVQYFSHTILIVYTI
jgi:hypothetical protein